MAGDGFVDISLLIWEEVNRCIQRSTSFKEQVDADKLLLWLLAVGRVGWMSECHTLLIKDGRGSRPPHKYKISWFIDDNKSQRSLVTVDDGALSSMSSIDEGDSLDPMKRV